MHNVPCKGTCFCVVALWCEDVYAIVALGVFDIIHQKHAGIFKQPLGTSKDFKSSSMRGTLFLM